MEISKYAGAGATEVENQGLEAENQGIGTENQGFETEAQAFGPENQELETEPQAFEKESQGLETETQAFESENQGFVTHLHGFDGPLDLLLHLIRKAKLRIEDIFVSNITEQYFSYMTEAHELDMDHASAFLAVAATLLEIKARAMLPKPPQPEPDEEDLEKQLIAQLSRYQLFCEAGQQLRGLESQQAATFTRLPQEFLDDADFVLDKVSVGQLFDAFAALLARTQALDEPQYAHQEIARDTYTITECALKVVRALQANKKIRFTDLFAPKAAVSEWITMFLAVLELVRRESIYVAQSAAFGEIDIVLRT